jgi:CRP-like cAMP-binding protein
METYVFEDGEYIIKQGEKGENFYIVEEGTVKW